MALNFSAIRLALGRKPQADAVVPEPEEEVDGDVCVACGRKTATPLCVDIGVVCNADCLYDIMPDHPMLNGYSPEHWEQREHMKEVEAKLQEAEDLARKYGFLS